MDRIICIVGESGSGKSTVAEFLEKEGYNYIQSYTTRPQRRKGELGHIFVDMNKYIADKKEGDIVAETYFNNNYYWSTKTQYQNKGKSVYTVDAKGSKELKEKIEDAEVISIFLKCEERTRIERMYWRKYNYITPEEKAKVNEIRNLEDFDEDIVDRIKNDRQVFKIVSCDYVVDANRSIEEVLEDVKSLI